MTTINFWTFSRVELKSLTEMFSVFFQAKNLVRDYENVWEWIEGFSDKFNASLNISREHNWDTGEKHSPLIIKIDFSEEKISQDKIKSIGKSLALLFNENVFQGEIFYIENKGINSYYDIKLHNTYLR